jgi:pyrroloquinoline quinone biosynthesis protein E
VKDLPLREIWYESDAFNRFRGFDWMKEPCRSCEEKTIDLGGCRCQAYLLTQDPANADPVCDKSPHHESVVKVVRAAAAREPNEQPVIFRNDANSRRFTSKSAAPDDPPKGART